MRSRTVSRPWSRCRLTLSTPPISRANASRRARSSSSGFQFMHLLRRDDLIVMRWHRKRLVLDPIAEEIVGALQHAADRSAQLQKRRGGLLEQPPLVIHGGQKPGRDHHECLILRRLHRHGETIDMRAPQAAGHDIAMLAQKTAVALDARTLQPGVV